MWQLHDLSFINFNRANRPKSYITRTIGWEQYPNGRWGDASNASYGALTDHQVLAFINYVKNLTSVYQIHSMCYLKVISDSSIIINLWVVHETKSTWQEDSGRVGGPFEEVWWYFWGMVFLHIICEIFHVKMCLTESFYIRNSWNIALGN